MDVNDCNKHSSLLILQIRVGSTRLGSSLAFKYKTMEEENDCNKHSSLLMFKIRVDSTRLGSSLAPKCKKKMEINDCNKHSSLPQYGINNRPFWVLLLASLFSFQYSCTIS